MRVVLTESEIMLAAMTGVMRQVQNIALKRKPRNGAGNYNDWQIHVQGCLGELVVAKAAKVFWTGNLGRLDQPDVERLQVRCSHKSDGELILHHYDKDKDIFILVTGVNGTHDIRGYIRAKAGKQPIHWRDKNEDETPHPRPAFFVLQKYLHPIEKFLPQIVKYV
jgi:hypothetical protein